MYFENFDLENMVTPVHVDALKKLLNQTGYDQRKTEFLIDGFTNGFSIGYNGPLKVQQRSPNLKLKGIGDKVTLWNKVMKEVKLKRYAGPFKEIPFEHYIQSPIGLVPKDNGKDTRLIFHLSYPRNSGKSVNENTPKEWCTVKYPDFNKAIQLCLQAGRYCNVSKSDMKSAFRNLGIKKSHWKFLIMMAESPIDGNIYYFVDKCLPFGAAISCAHFQAFSDAVAHIVKVKTKADNVNYLDDFLFVALLKAICNTHLDKFLEICQEINFPVSLEKTFRGATLMTFLGFLIDTIERLVLIPSEKVEKAIKMIEDALHKKSGKITLHNLQKICGFFNFLGRCIVPGRAFNRRLYAYTANPKLKKHHHIRINGEMRRDLEMWLLFVKDQSIYARGFMDFTTELTADVICMYSDASKAVNLAMVASVMTPGCMDNGILTS